MTSLFVDRRGVEIRLDGEALTFYEKDERVATVPIAPLERIYVFGDTLVRAGLLAKLGERGVGVVFLSGRRFVPSLFLPKPHNDAVRRVRQYELSSSNVFKMRFSSEIVARKIQAQRDCLLSLKTEHSECENELIEFADRLLELLPQVEGLSCSAELRGLEGAAAKVYFSGIARVLPKELCFSGRNRRPPRDPFNVILSLGYTLLHSEAVLISYGMGLDPYIGFYHSSDFGRESLACDLIEDLRPLVDRFSIRLFEEKVLTIDDFSRQTDSCLLGKSGRTRFYPAWDECRASLRSALEDRASELLRATTELSNMPDVERCTA